MAKAGEIYYSDMPYPDGEMWVQKPRPLLVLAVYGNSTNQVALMCMITSSPKRVNNPRKSDILISDWRQSGLSKESLIAPQRILTLDASVLIRRLGCVSPSNLTDARNQLKRFIDQATT